MIKFNHQIKLAIADVDDTIAIPYTPATSEMIMALEKFIKGGRALYLISGGGLQSIMDRVTNLINPESRNHILIAHCSGAEVWGFDKLGKLKDKPFYSKYSEQMSDEQKMKWREIVSQIESEFDLEVYPTIPSILFEKQSNGKKNAVMKADRGPQITWEFVNNPDIRDEVIKRANQLLAEAGIPIDSRKGGVFALDLALKGISKDFAVKFVIDNDDLLRTTGSSIAQIEDKSKTIEVWGDRYMEGKGSDQHMSIALPHNVRSIDFRPDEDPTHFPRGYNIVRWDGKETLSAGLLEYLTERR